MLSNSSNDSLPPAPKNSQTLAELKQAWHMIIVAIVGFTVAAVAIFLMFLVLSKPQDQSSAEDTIAVTDPETPSTEPQTPVFIDLQPTIDQWLRTIPSTDVKIGLEIYHLDHNQIAATYHADEVFNIASIYKLFFVYPGYRLIDSQVIDGESHFVTTTDYRTGNYSFSECLDLTIRESYNGCADPMRENTLLAQQAQNFINELNLVNTTNLGLYSTADNLTKLLIHVWQHLDLSDQSWQSFSDSMLVQPPTAIDSETTYDWRQGLPSGFSDQVNVYDKVGWAWNDTNWATYADAAILDFPIQNHHYTVVVLTSNLPDVSVLTTLGQMLESTIINNSL